MKTYVRILKNSQMAYSSSLNCEVISDVFFFILQNQDFTLRYFELLLVYNYEKG